MATVATVAVALGGLTACGRAVTIEPGSTDPSTVTTCRELAARLPAEFGGSRQVAIADGNGTTAAWGGPPIVWRCGVLRPRDLEPTSQLIRVNGSDWFPQTLTDGVRFTSVGPQPLVELTVPDAYPAPAELLTQVPTASHQTPSSSP